jgi:phage recombination protein Bet
MNELTKPTEYKVIEYQSRAGTAVHFTIEEVKKFMVRGNPENVTLQELVFFSGVCRARGLDPVAGDCYLIKFGQDPAAIVTARAYFEARAKAQADCDGWKAGIVVLLEEGQGEEVRRIGALPRPGDLLIGGWFEGHSSKWKFPLELEVNLPMYIKKTKQGAITRFWSHEKQAHMIRKVALVQGLRELWPNEFANLYAPEEIHPEAEEPTTITIDSPATPARDLKSEIEKKAAEETVVTAEEAQADLKEKQEETQRKLEDQAGGPLPTSDEAEADEVRNALIKTFDARLEKAGIPQGFVTDFLFNSLTKAQEQGFDFQSIPELKVWTVEQKRLDQFMEDLQKFADKQAGEDLKKEEKVSCSNCKKALEEQEVITVDNGEGDGLYYCAECAPPLEPPELVPGDPDWRKMEDEEAIKQFVNHRSPDSFRKLIAAHPEVVQCSNAVQDRLSKKWNSTSKKGERFGGLILSWQEFQKQYMYQNEPDPSTVAPPGAGPGGMTPPPERFCTQEQHTQIDKMVTNKFGSWKNLMEYALYINDAVATEVAGETRKRLTYEGAESIIRDPDTYQRKMLQYFDKK